MLKIFGDIFTQNNISWQAFEHFGDAKDWILSLSLQTSE